MKLSGKPADCEAYAKEMSEIIAAQLGVDVSTLKAEIPGCDTAPKLFRLRRIRQDGDLT